MPQYSRYPIYSGTARPAGIIGRSSLPSIVPHMTCRAARVFVCLSLSLALLVQDVKSAFTSRRYLRSGCVRDPSIATLTKEPILQTKFSVDNDSIDDELLFRTPRSTVAQPLSLLLLSQFILYIGVGAVIPSIPLYGKEIGLSGAANGIVISTPAVALLLLANVSGRFADQARKPAMIIGMAVIVVSDIGTACAQGLMTLIIARLGLGAGRGISEAGERGMLADLASRVPSLRGRALAAQQAVVALGIAIGAPAGGLIVEDYGPRASFLCVSAAAFVAFLMYFFLPETTANSAEVDTIPESKSKLKNTINTMNRRESARKVVQWSLLLEDDKWKGLAICQSGASFGFAAKIASIPLLASATLPGGAIGAGALLSATGLSGLVGAPLGGFITDKVGARTAAVIAGIISGSALMAIPLAFSPELVLSFAPWLQTALDELNLSDQIIHTSIGDMNVLAAVFCGLVIVWGTAVAAQGPAMTALAQEWAPVGSEATSLALPKAAADGTYIVAPFLLGLLADKFATPGIECSLAGVAAFSGALVLAISDYRSNDKT